MSRDRSLNGNCINIVSVRQSDRTGGSEGRQKMAMVSCRINEAIRNETTPVSFQHEQLLTMASAVRLGLAVFHIQQVQPTFIQEQE
jgi:hypothetical protein